MRPHLHSALSLFFGLPPVFIKHIADRLGCGLAVMMQSCYHLFDTDEEWGVVGGLLDIASQHQGGRPFVFNGILSCLRRGIPTLPLLEMNFVNYSKKLSWGIVAACSTSAMHSTCESEVHMCSA